jgi:hypothetical protein
MHISELMFWAFVAFTCAIVAIVGFSPVQEAHDTRPHRYIVERDTVF